MTREQNASSKNNQNLDLGIIGNCSFSALIDKKANISFMCWPRFDSEFVFSSLLDSENGGKFQINSDGKDATLQQYIPNTNVLKSIFTTDKGTYEVIDFAPRFKRNDRNYKPVSLVRIVRILSGEPVLNVDINPVHNHAKERMSAVVSSNHIRFEGGDQVLRLYSNMSLNILLEGRPFPAENTLYFYLTSNAHLNAPLRETCEEYYIQTVEYWEQWIKHCVLPRKYQEEVIRSALTLKLHQFEDTGAVIAATTTSIPEAQGTVRNWDYRFCWLRDAQMVVWAMHTLSHFEELDEFIKFLKFLTQNEADLLQPVYGISGQKQLTELSLDHLPGYQGNKPVRIGNDAYRQIQHDVYGGLIVAISPHYLDIRFRNSSNPMTTRLLHHLLMQIEKYIMAEDAGIWEYRHKSRVHTYTLLQHWKGAMKAMEISKFLKDDKLLQRSTKVANCVSGIIYNQAWRPESQIFSQDLETDLVDASLLQMVNLGFLDPDDPKTAQHVDSTIKLLKTDAGLLKRYIHQDDFGDTENAFIICSFWLVEALARIGRMDEATQTMERLLEISNHLGLYSEDYDPETKQLWGNFPQTYSHVGLIRAAFALSPPWYE